jgi:hypothetical protein
MEFWLPDVGDPHWIRDLRSRSGARVVLKLCRSTGTGERWLLQFVELTADAPGISSIEQQLRHDHRFRELSVVRLGPSRLFVRAVVPAPRFCHLSQRSGAVCSVCRFVGGARWGPADWVVVLPGASEARPLLRELGRRGDGEGTPTWKIRRYAPSGGLTPRQADALEAAVQLGYYRFPRRGRLADVGRTLGISRSTAAELLRRAEAKIVSLAIAG